MESQGYYRLPRQKIMGWHVLDNNYRLRNGDRRIVKLHEPMSIRENERVEVCGSGMHACDRILDCLSYVDNSHVFCRVMVEGELERWLEEGDKFAGRTRTVLKWTTPDGGKKALDCFMQAMCIEIVARAESKVMPDTWASILLAKSNTLHYYSHQIKLWCEEIARASAVRHDQNTTYFQSTRTDMHRFSGILASKVTKYLIG